MVHVNLMLLFYFIFPDCSLFHAGYSEAEVWYVNKLQAGSAWTSSSFSSDIEVEWTYTRVKLPDYTPTPLNDVNMRHQEPAKSAKVYYPDAEAIGTNRELMEVYPYEVQLVH